MLPADILDGYRAFRRPETDQSVLCHAPFVSLNFERSGKVTSCCYNRSVVLGTYPSQTLAEIWNSVTARGFRREFLEQREASGCTLCFHQLESSNFSGTLMKNFDEFAVSTDYTAAETMPFPRVLEFEISNTCNLECVMCDGRWSSSIRARREKLPPLHSPYDQAFVEQLDVFLPHIRHAKFLGGEPFLIRRYCEIWERLALVNPSACLTVTTNASVLPARAMEVLEGLRANFVVSLDAVTPSTYEAIRRNARLDEVLSNVEVLLEYTKRRGTGLSLAVCPMTHNWRELDRIIAYADARQLTVHFNMVMRPREASLMSLPHRELDAVVASLGTLREPERAASNPHTRANVDGLIRQVAGWRDEKIAFETRVRTTQAALRHAVTKLPMANAARERLEAIVDPAAYAYAVGRELDGAAHGDFHNMFPEPPLELWTVRPDARSLIVASALLAASSGGVGPDAQASDQAMLHEVLGYPERLDAATITSSERVERLADWLDHELVHAHARRIAATMRAFSASCADVDHAGSSFDLALREGLEPAVSSLAARGVDARRLHGARAYVLEHLQRSSVLDWWPEGEARPPVTELPVDAEGLQVRLAALHLCHLCVDPPAHPQHLTDAVDRIHAELFNDSDTADACRAIDRIDLGESYRRFREQVSSVSHTSPT